MRFQLGRCLACFSGLFASRVPLGFGLGHALGCPVGFGCGLLTLRDVCLCLCIGLGLHLHQLGACCLRGRVRGLDLGCGLCPCLGQLCPLPLGFGQRPVKFAA